ncbi:hypothetical protein PQR53_07790 [Paraburkholderia fungorum]|uniref:hypothetical protein n=1 Tax=Paraburkholderia fungorum TaxID=134537 RepID=UPI0038BC6613
MINNAGFKLPDNLPDQSKLSSGAAFAENKKIASDTEKKHPGKSVIVRDKVVYKPNDICVRFADSVVDTNTHKLRTEILKLSAVEFSKVLVKDHGKRYSMTEKFQSQDRPIVAKRSLAISISKVLDRLTALKVMLPIPDVDKMSFNDLRKYLLGTGSYQPNMITLNTLVEFYPSKVVIGRAVWHWRDAFGKKSTVKPGSYLQSTTEDKLSMTRLCSMLGLSEGEILAKCYSGSTESA